jgi:hypothetical protein
MKAFKHDVTGLEAFKHHQIVLRLERYVNTVESMLSHIRVINPYNNYEIRLRKNVDARVVTLYHKLIESSVRLNFHYRVGSNDGGYLATKEDMVNALELVKKIVHYQQPKAGLNCAETRTYEEIRELKGNEEFSIREIRTQIRSRCVRSLYHHIHRLCDAQLMTMTYHNNRLGHRFRIIARDE